jgi:uncharacterized membrane-anchored protein
MSDRLRRVVAAFGLALIAFGAAMAVVRHEETLASGRVVLLELAPVDPRSLMQGDYMALNFRIAGQVPREPPQGTMVVRLDEHKVASYVRVHAGEAVAPEEALLEYRVRSRGVRIVTDAWFFEEGRAGDFRSARYGEFRVRPDGVALLVALRGADFQVLGAQRTGG